MPWRELQSRRHTGPIVVGLVNNMPDAALKTTERQFRELIADAAGPQAVRVRVFSLPGLDRSDAARRHVAENHEDIEELWGAELDGLIVTGTEPRAERLADEPYWPALTRLIDWAAEHTISSAWSCLAAHAAVHHLDGLVRRPLAAKLSGVFECGGTVDHPLLGRFPARWRTPAFARNELRRARIERTRLPDPVALPRGRRRHLHQARQEPVRVPARAPGIRFAAPCCGNTAATSAAISTASATPIRTCRAAISTRRPPRACCDFREPGDARTRRRPVA